MIFINVTVKKLVARFMHLEFRFIICEILHRCDILRIPFLDIVQYLVDVFSNSEGDLVVSAFLYIDSEYMTC